MILPLFHTDILESGVTLHYFTETGKTTIGNFRRIKSNTSLAFLLLHTPSLLSMADTTKDQIKLDIRSPEHIPMDKTEGSLKTPFFSSPSSRRKENTWIISLFVVLHFVVFAATMIVNDCPQNSNGDCILASIGRLSFQPFSENPLLGPSSSTLNEMGALQRKLLTHQHQIWRLLTAPWLHAGIIDLLINISSVIFVGIYLEQRFGSWRIGLIYTLSAFVGSLTAAIFVNNNPAVVSSGALFGLLGAMLSALIRNWKIYSDQYAAMLTLFSITTINIALGLLPHVDNFSKLGGFLSGVLLGFMFLFNPQLGEVPQNKIGLYEISDKASVTFRQKLDKPVMRIVSLVLFILVLAGGIVAVLHGVNANNYCTWCHHIDCVPSKRWSCYDKKVSCKVTVNAGRLTVACKSNDKYHVFPFTDVSKARIGDLCSQLCS